MIAPRASSYGRLVQRKRVVVDDCQTLAPRKTAGAPPKRSFVMRLKNFLTWPTLVVGLSLPALIDCSDAVDAASGCDELNTGGSAVANLSIDAKFKAFVQAASDLRVIATAMKTEVRTACANIATGLGEADTWSSHGESDAAVTAACTVASAKIDSILTANANAQATITVTGAQCSVNADIQAMCEGSCKADVSCTEPELAARCDPGQLSAVCDAECKGGATCQGTAMVAADCQGTCEAECTGTCSGSCSGTITGGCDGMCTGKCDGMATPSGGMASCAGTCEGTCTRPKATATCTGKCEASCKGKCTGNCTLEASANVKCGAMVSCKGGCTTTFTAPKCEAELRPPTCMGDASCQASCSGRGQVNAQCTKPSVKVVYAAETEDLTKLKTVLEANLPAIWLAAKTQGQLALNAAGKVVTTGQAAVSGAASASGKAIACVGAAAKASAEASASVDVSVKASVSVSGSATAG
jgi:hypothetical protein